MKKIILLITLLLPLTSLASESLGEAHNNPLNIMATSIQWEGEIKCQDNRTEVDGQKTECFEHVVYGIRAAIIILKNYQSKYHINTLEELTKRWATGRQKDYAQYLAYVLGIEINTPFQLSGNPIFTANLIEAMIEFENGRSIYDFDKIYQLTVFMDWTE